MKTFWSFASLILMIFIVGAVLSAPRVGITAFLQPLDRILDLGVARPPKAMLWAWERPEDLSFIDPDEVGVAFLAQTVYLCGDKVMVRPRLQPLQVPENTVLMAVVRIESDRVSVPLLTPEQRQQVVVAITKVSRIPGIAGIQLDYDATVSERGFYRDLLFDLRRSLPSSMTLSMTALASWCLGDNWVSDLPVDEAVPMLFRMGPDQPEVLGRLWADKDFYPTVCRESMGISVDEPLPRLPSGRHVYIFRPRAWSEKTVREALVEARQWQRRP